MLDKVITREEATGRILAAKKLKGLTFEQIAQTDGRDKVWTTAALLGQHPMEQPSAAVLATLQMQQWRGTERERAGCDFLK